ncbi:hypothetical protein Scep_003833 [Stephania cephalantha]|uniref:Phosphoribosylformylglycinamidine synthase N-terminal domain-containing protein n=1 Tax=Stephania cephalantha TaxID=152367 RepID=A0AAP0KU13_9MAGN
MAAAAAKITAVDFLQGSCRQSLFPETKSRHSHRLWGSIHRRRTAVPLRLSTRGSIISNSSRVLVPVRPKALISDNVSALVDGDSAKMGDSQSKVVHLFRCPLIQESASVELLKLVQTKISNQIIALKTEQCFNVRLDSDLSSEKFQVLKWLLQETYEPENLGAESFLDEERQKDGFNVVIVEVGPRLSFTTTWSANAVSICLACGLTEINRMERSRRYLLYVKAGSGCGNGRRSCI